MKNLYNFVLFFLPLAALAQTPTWAEDVAPILYAHCTQCHHNGGIGGFPLMSYSEASVSYVDLASATSSGEMPPWKPNPSYRHFKDENVLSPTQIQTIADWVSGGKPQGNLANAPTPPTYNSGSQLPQIDFTVTMPSYTVSTNQDDYRSFVIPNSSTTDQYLNQIEYIPGNGQVVHHIVFYYDPSSQSQLLDNLDPGPGFQSFGVGPISGQAEWIGAWAPGQGITELPVNMGIKIPAGADYVMEVHYAPGYSGSQDQSSINLKFTPAAGVREAYTKPILDYQNDITDGPLFIPKNTVQTFHQEDGVGGTDISLIGLFPHMHRIGKSYKIFSVDTANDTLPLIEIPEWDFHWQGYYTVQQLLKIPKNSTLYGIATYDNTVNNPDNPSSPPQDVSAGENTTDEMMICFFTYTNYQAGDENIILDSTLLNTSLPPSIHSTLKVYPNPTTDIVTVVFQNSMPFTLRLLDLQGKLIEEKTNNTPIQMLDIRSFEAGIYLLEVQTEAGVATYKIWKK